MAIFPDSMPRPVPTMDDTPFWAACSKQTLKFQTCADCKTPRHPPTPVCPNCHSLKSEWIEAPTPGRIYTFTVVHHASHPAVKEKLPYVAGLIVFDGLPGVRLVSNITHCEPAAVTIGMPVELWWDDIGDGQFLPRFKPAREG